MPGCRTLSTHTDDYGFHNVGWRNGEMRTPTIDRLAAEGIVLERHYAFHFCSPSRSSFLSGESHKQYTYSNIILTPSYRDSRVEAARWPMRARVWSATRLRATTMPSVLNNLSPLTLRSTGDVITSEGRLPFHVNQGQPQDILSTGGVDIRMSTLGDKFQEAGWESHMVGKWHVGARSPANIPINRGFNTSLAYLKGAENHFTQHVPDSAFGDKVDLWLNDGPAFHLNGTAYGTHLFADYAISIINEYAATGPNSKGLFLYIAWQNTHAPLQVPTAYCYNSSSTNKSSGPPPLAVSSDCPTEGPHEKGHSWCYCYDNEGPSSASIRSRSRSCKSKRKSKNTAFALAAGVHGNQTAGGDNMDRHTFNAMASQLINPSRFLNVIQGRWWVAQVCRPAETCAAIYQWVLSIRPCLFVDGWYTLLTYAQY